MKAPVAMLPPNRGRRAAILALAKAAGAVLLLAFMKRRKLSIKLPALTLLALALFSQRAPTPTLTPKGAPRHLPFIGLFHRVHEILDVGFAKFFLDVSRDVGWVNFHMCIPGGRKILIVNDEADRRYALRTNWRNFVKNTEAFGFDMYYEELLGRGIFATDGGEWKHSRKVAAHLFSHHALEEQMERVFIEHSRALAAILREKAESRETFDLQNMMQAFTFDTMCEIAFGEHPKSLESARSGIKPPFLVSFDEAQRICTKRMVTGPNLLWQLIRWLRLDEEGAMAKHTVVMHEYVQQIIERRKAEPEGSRRSDLLSLFMQRARESGDKSLLTDDHLRDVVLNFMIAGRDTTSSATSNLFKLLCTNAGAAAKLRADLRAAVPVGKDPSLVSLSKALYGDASFSEAIRMYPPVGVDARFALNDDVLPSGTRVYAGNQITIPNFAIGRNPSIWGADADLFIPERWFDRAGKVTKQVLSKSETTVDRKDGEPSNLIKEQYTMPAFWAGPRLCLGKDMARFEVKVVAYTVLVEANLELQVHPHDDTFLSAPVMFYKSGMPTTCTVGPS